MVEGNPDQGGLFEDASPSVGGSGEAQSYFHPGSHAPLAVRMRPRKLEEVVGQQKILGAGSPLRRLIAGQGDSSVILYGPPGTGKTTIASLIANATGRRFQVLSALNSGVKEIREVVTQARRALAEGERTVLFIDEVHRFSKTQQDALLAAVENRTVLLVAATTENPSFAVVGPLLSRSLLLQLTHLSESEIEQVVRSAVTDERGLAGKYSITDDAVTGICALAGGDARRALTYLEAAAEGAGVDDAQGIEADGDSDDSGADGETQVAHTAGKNQRTENAPVRVITAELVEKSVDRALVHYDRDGDQHYDVTSAFIKSIRGSDVDAALHYLARMTEAGEDPRFIARRLIILASEDIGMADPTSLNIATSAMQAVSMIGMPEARITLAHATIHLATAAKSNSVIKAIDAAIADVRAGKAGAVPPHLRDGHYAGAKRMGNAVGYVYPHDDPIGVVAQQYSPDVIKDTQYYVPTNHGHERTILSRLGTIRDILTGRKKRT